MPLSAQQLINHRPPQARYRFSRAALFAAVAVASQMTQASEPPTPEQQMVLFSEDIAAQLDWQPLPLITETQRNLRCRQCNGQFVDPLKGQPPTAPGSADIKV
ncbi:MAG: LPS-assembly protein LptD, partial [Luminiphilus sp.]|nr:LPS-assembly protein LptD [Luminiphilus sp.]